MAVTTICDIRNMSGFPGGATLGDDFSPSDIRQERQIHRESARLGIKDRNPRRLGEHRQKYVGQSGTWFFYTFTLRCENGAIVGPLITVSSLGYPDGLMQTLPSEPPSGERQVTP